MANSPITLRYIALRGSDLSPLQHRLAAFGLSSLGRSETAVMPALEAQVVTLERCGTLECA